MNLLIWALQLKKSESGVPTWFFSHVANENHPFELADISLKLTPYRWNFMHWKAILNDYLPFKGVWKAYLQVQTYWGLREDIWIPPLRPSKHRLPSNYRASKTPKGGSWKSLKIFQPNKIGKMLFFTNLFWWKYKNGLKLPTYIFLLHFKMYIYRYRIGCVFLNWILRFVGF